MAGKGKKKTHEEFVQEVEEQGNGSYQLLSTYVNTRTKVLMKHLTCNHEYEVTPDRFLMGRRCPNCKAKNRKTDDEFAFEVFSLEGKDYRILTRYINNKSPVWMEHVTCGNEYEVTPSHFLNGQRCPKCSLKKRSKNHTVFAKEFEKISNGEYTLLSTYERSKTKIHVLHHSCGKEYRVAPYHFLKGSKCPHCNGKIKKTHAEFEAEVCSLTDGDYELISEYKGSRNQVSLRHKSCGHEYQVRPNHFTAGSRCPKCASSKGEQRIKAFLENIGVSFIQEFTMEDCRNRRPLRFDFMIQREDGEPALLIEFDGIQHYQELAYFGGREGYINRVKNDRIKSNYAKENLIPLLRIRYNQKNPEKLIQKVFEKIQVKQIAKEVESFAQQRVS